MVISYCFEFRASNFGFVDPVRVGKRGSNTPFVLKVLGIFQERFGGSEIKGGLKELIA